MVLFWWDHPPTHLRSPSFSERKKIPHSQILRVSYFLNWVFLEPTSFFKNTIFIIFALLPFHYVLFSMLHELCFSLEFFITNVTFKSFIISYVKKPSFHFIKGTRYSHQHYSFDRKQFVPCLSLSCVSIYVTST